MGGETIGQEVLYAVVSLGCQPSGIVRAGVTHHNHWGRVVTVHKKPALLVYGKVERAADSQHALVTQTDFSRTQQLGKRPRLILGLEEPEKSGGIPIPLFVQFINLGADPTDWPGPAVGKPKKAGRVREVGVAGRNLLASL